MTPRTINNVLIHAKSWKDNIEYRFLRASSRHGVLKSSLILSSHLYPSQRIISILNNALRDHSHVERTKKGTKENL